jgi:hypothetical protein
LEADARAQAAKYGQNVPYGIGITDDPSLSAIVLFGSSHLM